VPTEVVVEGGMAHEGPFERASGSPDPTPASRYSMRAVPVARSMISTSRRSPAGAVGEAFLVPPWGSEHAHLCSFFGHREEAADSANWTPEGTSERSLAIIVRG
jgi:hypothetical protein